MIKSRYYAKTAGGKHEYTHHAVWREANGPIPEGMMIDHINGDTHDNRLENLRVVTRQENMMNVKLRTDNTSGVVGVSYDKSRDKWMVYASKHSQRTHLGRYDDWFEAVCARMSANNRYGFHENHGRR